MTSSRIQLLIPQDNVSFTDKDRELLEYQGEQQMARILAVDDAKTMRDLVKGILENAGHEVLVADDGDTAMQLARKEAVDLVVSDVNMPRMSGISLVTKLRRLPDYENTPILMLTTEGDGYKKTKAKSVGASGWLQKPFDPPRLLKAVEKMIA